MRARLLAPLLTASILLVVAPAVAQDEGDGAVEDPIVLTFDADTPALHIPVGRQSVEIVPAFEDYAFMLYDLCDGLGLTGDECLIFPMNGDLGGNAIATVVEGSPIIVYDRTLSQKAGYAGAMGIIAHELGHHRCGHLGTAPDPRKELAADEARCDSWCTGLLCSCSRHSL